MSWRQRKTEERKKSRKKKGKRRIKVKKKTMKDGKLYKGILLLQWIAAWRHVAGDDVTTE